MTFKRIITVILLACFTMALFTAMPTYAMADSPTLSWEEKIDSAIWNTTPDENGRYLVYVSRTGVDADKIEKEFNRRNEFSLSDYQDKATYRRKVGPSVALLAIEKYGMYNSLQLDYGRELFNDELAPIEYELIENYNEFIMNKRTVITDLYGTYNQSFADKFNIASDLVLYEGQYTGSYVLYATRDEIEAMAKDSSVERVMGWSETIDTTETNIQYVETNAISQIGADSVAGTQGIGFNNGTGYKGTGIKVGIIESEQTNMNLDWAMLDVDSFPDSLLEIEYIENGNISSTDSDHASMVASIIAGQKIVIGSNVYEGVVPNATVYQTTHIAASMSTFLDAFELLINRGVSVINYSSKLAENDTGTYDDSCVAEIDNLVLNTGVSFVKSAGNSGSSNGLISTPGMGYNIVTVGSVDTISYNSNTNSVTILQQPYSVANYSSYHESNNYLTNKPDLVAPGSYITVVKTHSYSETTLYRGSGTSFAAPYVTGVIAQMFQADETLMGNPIKTKAILLAGADPTVVSTSGNAEAFTDSELIREKSGLGMVNAINSVRIAEAGENNSAGTMLYLDATSTANHTGTLEDSIHLEGGQTIRIVLTFNKPDGQTVPNSGYQYNTALKLYRGTEPEETSSFVYSNVQVIEYTVPEDKAGTYSIKHTVFRFALISQPLQWRIYAAWRIFPADN